jgi:hypothetical protein
LLCFSLLILPIPAPSTNQTLPESPMPSTYIKAGKKDVNQTIFMCAEDSLKRYTEFMKANIRSI